MNPVEFQATVHNGVISLPNNQQSWNGKKIKVILLDEASTDAAELSANGSTSEADFLAVQVFGKTGTSIRNPYALRHGYSLNHKVSIPDMLIAATAISHELELYTLNTKDFKFIPELNLYRTE